MAGDNLRVFVALEGGGAKGLVHIGALKALEERAVKFCGLAGTSAGAIVAALKAAGYGADELVDPVRETTLLPQVDPTFKSATDFFGYSDWARIRIFRNLIVQFGSSKLKKIVIFCFLIGIVPASIGLAAFFFGAFAAFAGIFAWIAIAIFLWFVVVGGLASVKTFRDTLGRALQRKMFPGDDKRVVRFSDFGHGDVPSLKIVATNITRGELRLFSPDETPDIAVADAVAASICLPVIFRAWTIDEMLHFDGGLVSNLPAWTFDEERSLDPDAMTIAIEILSASTNAVKPTARRWLVPAIRTAIFGSSILNKRAVGRFEVVQLKTDLDLLAFDAQGEKVFQVMREATAASRARIVQQLFTLPQLYSNACSAVRDLVHDVLLEETRLLGGTSFMGRIRVALAVPEDGHRKSLRLKYGVGFDTEADTDEELLLPIADTNIGVAFEKNEAAFAYFRVPGGTGTAVGERPPTQGLDRRRQRLIWREVAWRLCIPIAASESASPLFVVTVDCNQPIDPEAENFPDVLDLFQEEIETIFRAALKNLAGGV